MSRRKNKAYVDEFYGNRFHHNCNDDVDNGVDNEATQVSDITQGSFETIEIKDSCDVRVTTSDTQVGVSLQAALQVAIAIVINISIADDTRAEQVTNDLLQRSSIGQFNRQHIKIEGSQEVEVRTRDTDVAVSLQVLIQILFALLIQLDIL